MTFLSAVECILPEQRLEKITGQSVSVHQPCSFFPRGLTVFSSTIRFQLIHSGNTTYPIEAAGGQWRRTLEKTTSTRLACARRSRTAPHSVDRPAGSRHFSSRRHSRDASNGVSPESRPGHGFGSDQLHPG